MVNAQEWLDKNYPKEERKNVASLNISKKDLKGSLDLNDFVSLDLLDCSNNQLTNLDLTNCHRLRDLKCQSNYLQNLKFPLQSEQLTKLRMCDNNLSEQDLSVFSRFVNLKELYISNYNQEKINQGIYNRFSGSLEPLKNLSKLKWLNISNTDINSGVEHLPCKLGDYSRAVSYSSKWRPESKVKEIEAQLNLFADKVEQRLWAEKGFTYEQALKRVCFEAKHGLCRECKQPNAGKQWCRSCNSQYLKMRFKNWTSGNQIVDELIQKSQLEATNANELLEWIPYEQFVNVKYLAKGGFGNVYKAEWPAGIKDNPIAKWNKSKNEVINKIVSCGENHGKIIRKETVENIIKSGDASHKLIIIDDSGGYKSFDWVVYGSAEFGHYLDKRFVALKILNDSQNITADFLQEITNHKLVECEEIVSCFGISQDPETKNYLMVMDYIKDGSLQKYLQNNHEDSHDELEFYSVRYHSSQNNRLGFSNKLHQLFRIAQGLNQIHKQGLIHCDLHAGNILSGFDGLYITDLGLCRPANETNQEKIYGVLPYVAPEVLRGRPYTQASDIYSFGIVVYEMLSGLSPHYGQEHNEILGVAICQGLRPQFNIKIPPLLEDLIKKCWDSDPSKRPTADELEGALKEWQRDEEFQNQLRETEEFNKSLPNETKYPKYEIHQGAVYHSRLLPTEEITRVLSQPQKTSEQFYELKETSDLDSLRISSLKLNPQKENQEINSSNSLSSNKNSLEQNLANNINISELTHRTNQEITNKQQNSTQETQNQLETIQEINQIESQTIQPLTQTEENSSQLPQEQSQIVNNQEELTTIAQTQANNNWWKVFTACFNRNK